jgi:DNA-binding FrmR family transcriptional regulator
MRINDQSKKKILTDRLSRLSGQVNGIAAMIDREEDCTKIATQLSAVKSALNQTLATFTMCVFEEAEHPHDAASRTPDTLARVIKIIN